MVLVASMAKSLYAEPMAQRRMVRLPITVDNAAQRIRVENGQTWSGIVRVALIDYLERRHDLSFSHLVNHGGSSSAVRKVRLSKRSERRKKPVRAKARGAR